LIVHIFIFSYCVVYLFISLFVFLYIMFYNLLWALLNRLFNLFYYFIVCFTQHFQTNAFQVFVTFDFLCVVSNRIWFRCIIHIIHVYFLFFYYGCQMAGLIKSRVFIYLLYLCQYCYILWVSHITMCIL
jgi:hypothetical protein